MTWLEFRDLTAKERINRRPSRKRNLNQAIAAKVTQFQRVVRDENIRLDPMLELAHEVGKPPTEERIDNTEIAELVEGLFAIRRARAWLWTREPLPGDYDNEPRSRGERFLDLLRKYWLLVFGYARRSHHHARKEIEVSGIGRIIFEADRGKFDTLDVSLCISVFRGMSVRAVAAALAPHLPRHQRNLPKLAALIKKRVQRWEQQ